MTCPKITVAGRDSVGGLLGAIERALPVQFVRSTEVPEDPDADLELSYSSGPAGNAIAHRFHVARGGERGTDGPGTVAFADHPLLHAFLRGRTVPHEPVPHGESLQPQSSDVLLATAFGKPVWIARIRDKAVDEFTCVPLPAITGNMAAVDVLNGRNCLQLLPLLHFLRRALSDHGWKFPPPRASFMFDDPNLHRESYGFISYPQIVRHSERTHYHVAFATIPFDTWFTSRRAADAFRSHPDRISLLLHGNDHTYAELARVRSARTDRQLAAQAIARISRFEDRTGVRVCRTMAAPHGACSNDMMAAMLDVGIEGLFCSSWSLRLWDPSRTRLELGIPPAEVIGGFAVLPRFRLSSDCEGSAILCAFLGQPIVPVGHHQDLRDGVGLLDQIAGAINRLPNVTWGNTESLSRSNFISQTQPGNATMHVISYSTCIRIRIPDGIGSVLFHDARAPAQPPVSNRWVVCHPGANWIGCSPDQGFSVSPGEDLTFRLAGLGERAHRDLPKPRLCVSAPVRRFLCESRDRIAPTLRSIKLRIHSLSKPRVQRSNGL